MVNINGRLERHIETQFVYGDHNNMIQKEIGRGQESLRKAQK